jgi:zinc/manganese transport system ATP-binding protein
VQPECEVLAVRQASVSLSGRSILRDINFSLDSGVFCGLIGANGSGKTTLLRMILGFVSASSGTVTTLSDGRASIGYVPQQYLLDPYLPMRARDLVALGLDGNKLGIPFPSLQRHQKIDAAMTAVDASGFADQRIGNLSGGQQQRILIAHAMVRRPRLLLLDEPLANLDMRSVASIVALLRRLSRELGTAVLLSAHDMNPLMSVMDRVVYLANGRAVSGSTDAVIRTDVLSRLYGYHIKVLRVGGRVLVVPAETNLDESLDRTPIDTVALP